MSRDTDLDDLCNGRMYITQEHHRRPRSLGGKDDFSNISYVRKKDHCAWHLLFGNMNAYQIADWLNHHLIQNKPENVKIICEFINGSEVKIQGENNSKNRTKTLKAWSRLFGGMSFKDAIACINNMWLDPSYHLYVREK